MTVHTHGIEKAAKADSEKLPDVSGTKITYAGGVECQITVTERRNDEPTITAGAIGHGRRPHRRVRERAGQAAPAVQAGRGRGLGDPARARHRGRLRLGGPDLLRRT